MLKSRGVNAECPSDKVVKMCLTTCPLGNQALRMILGQPEVCNVMHKLSTAAEAFTESCCPNTALKTSKTCHAVCCQEVIYIRLFNYLLNTAIVFPLPPACRWCTTLCGRPSRGTSQTSGMTILPLMLSCLLHKSSALPPGGWAGLVHSCDTLSNAFWQHVSSIKCKHARHIANSECTGHQLVGGT